MKKRCLAIFLIMLMAMLAACGTVSSTDLKDVVINGYAVSTGKNEVFDKGITVSDVEKVLGKSYADEVYDYSQGFRKMTYRDDNNRIMMTFVYLKTADGKRINWIETTEMKEHTKAQ